MTRSSEAAKKRVLKYPKGFMSKIAKERHAKRTKEEKKSTALKMNEARWKTKHEK